MSAAGTRSSPKPALVTSLRSLSASTSAAGRVDGSVPSPGEHAGHQDDAGVDVFGDPVHFGGVREVQQGHVDGDGAHAGTTQQRQRHVWGAAVDGGQAAGGGKDGPEVALDDSGLDRRNRAVAAGRTQRTFQHSGQGWLVKLGDDGRAGNSAAQVRDMVGEPLGKGRDQLGGGAVVGEHPLAVAQLDPGQPGSTGRRPGS